MTPVVVGRAVPQFILSRPFAGEGDQP